MRILFSAYAEKTRFLSMVPLVWVPRRAGHQARVASRGADPDHLGWNVAARSSSAGSPSSTRNAEMATVPGPDYVVPELAGLASRHRRGRP